MAQRKAQYEITPQMHALMRAQRVSALKVEQAEKRARLKREFDRAQDEWQIKTYGIPRDDPRWPLVQKAIMKAVMGGMDHKNTRACRRVADKVLADIERKQRREETDVVYYLRHGGHIKIGTTKDLARRLREYPPGTELLATEAGSYLRERERLQQFAAHLVSRNEWFTPAPELMAHIDSLKQRVA